MSPDNGKIAVFWYTEEGVIGYAEAIDGHHTEDSGRFVGLCQNHFDLWSHFESHFSTEDMYYYPRGRVVYDKQTRAFKVICDPKLARSVECQNKIKNAYGFSGGILFDTDLHYRSAYRAPEFAEYTEEERADPFEE